ncbi:hypothetical protein ACFYKX_11040 [Cytobacillus sp. FJAT-54145]|uniref:DUF1366 domain-containing protein n=1 Tax=Cytobacillus spartinae TaxID=3299023 RepID=A0ABW6KA89_9BACI
MEKPLKILLLNQEEPKVQLETDVCLVIARTNGEEEDTTFVHFENISNLNELFSLGVLMWKNMQEAASSYIQQLHPEWFEGKSEEEKAKILSAVLQNLIKEAHDQLQTPNEATSESSETVH